MANVTLNNISKPNLSNYDWLIKTTFNNLINVNPVTFLLCYKNLFSNRLEFILGFVL